MLAITVFMLSYAAFASADVKVLIDGEEIVCYPSPFIQGETTLVPMRDIFEALGAQVIWNEETRSAEAFLGDIQMIVYPDEGIFEKNGEELHFPEKPILTDNRIMLPLRAIAEGFGYSVIWKDYTASISSDGIVKVHYLSCGQADCAFVELPDGKSMLIDAAESSFGKELEQYIRNLGYSHIDYVVATHPHSDHIGGMAHILSHFTVGTFYMPDVIHTTVTYEKMLDALYENGCKCEYISQGSIIAEGEYDIVVLSPENREYRRMNNYSAVIKLSYKDTSMLFSADAESDAETNMIAANLDLDADILKVGHHGSSTSSTNAYLDAVSPSVAVISLGKDNSYGFPDEIVMHRLLSRKIEVHRTDLEGTITAVSDGYIYVIGE